MRILLISSKWPTTTQEIDGGCMTAQNVLDAIVENSCVDLLLPEGYKDTEISGINKTYFYPVNEEIIENYNGKNKFLCRIKIAKIVASIVLGIYSDYDRIIILHAFHSFTICNGNYVSLQNKVILFPMLLTPAYIDSGEDVPDIYTKYEKNALQNVRTIITPSIYEYEQIKNFFNVISDKITIIPRFVGNEFEYVEQDSFYPIKLNICYIASIKKQKQNLEAAKLLHQLSKKLPNCFLYIVGPIHDEFEFDNLINYIHDYGLCDKVSIIQQMSQSEVNKLFSICFANISVARCETFGRAIIEGLYCGLPAFVLNETKCFKTLIGNNHGVIYSNSYEEMANQIIEIYNSPQKYKEMRTQARHFGVRYEENKIKPILKQTILCKVN